MLYGMWKKVKFVAVAVPVTLTVLDNVGTVARVNGASMMPTLRGDRHWGADYVWLDTWTSKDFTIRRGEIIALKSPDDPHRILIKRVIGIPGDVIKTPNYKQPVIFVREGTMWVEGDNQERSKDSNNFGLVPIGLMTAKATFIVWPPDRWRKLKEDPKLYRLDDPNVFLRTAREQALRESRELEDLEDKEEIDFGNFA